MSCPHCLGKMLKKGTQKIFCEINKNLLILKNKEDFSLLIECLSIIMLYS